MAEGGTTDFTGIEKLGCGQHLKGLACAKKKERGRKKSMAGGNEDLGKKKQPSKVGRGEIVIEKRGKALRNLYRISPLWFLTKN